MKFRIIILFAFVLNAVVSNAQKSEVTSLTLQQAVETAKKYNYTLQNSRLDQQLAEKKVNEILASGLPQINSGVAFTNNINVPTMSLPNFLKPSFTGSAYGQAFAAAKAQGKTDAEATTAGNVASNIVSQQVPDNLAAQFGTSYSLQASITLSQLIFDGTFFLGVKAAKEFVNLARLNVKRNEIETEVNVSKAYFMVLILESNYKLIDKNMETLEKTSNDVQALYKNGLAEKIDVDRLTVQLTNLKIQKGKIEDQINVSRRLLKLQIGIDLQDSVALTDEIEKLYDLKKLNQAAIDKAGFSNRIEVKMLDEQDRLNEYDTKRYKMGYLPSMNAAITELGNTYGQKDHIGDLGNTWYQGTILTVNMNIPIFDGFRKSTQIQATRINQLKAKNDRKNIESLIQTQVYQSNSSYERAKQTVEAQKNNMQLANDIYTRANIKYKNGVGSSLELASAQTDLETARTNYLTALFDVFVAEIDLRKALGEIK